jgi:hypothetical protein
LIQLPRSPTPPLARKRGRGRNIFLSCSGTRQHQITKTTSSPTSNPLLAPLSRSPTPPLARKRGRGRNIFLSCSGTRQRQITHQHPRRQPNIANQTIAQYKKGSNRLPRDILVEKIDGPIFFPLCQSYTIGGGGAPTRTGGRAFPVQPKRPCRPKGVDGTFWD